VLIPDLPPPADQSFISILFSLSVRCFPELSRVTYVLDNVQETGQSPDPRRFSLTISSASQKMERRYDFRRFCGPQAISSNRRELACRHFCWCSCKSPLGVLVGDSGGCSCKTNEVYRPKVPTAQDNNSPEDPAVNLYIPSSSTPQVSQERFSESGCTF